MKSRRKPASGRRNLLLVLLLVLVFGLLAAAVHLMNTTLPLILPEDRAELTAKRQSPDNAYPLLQLARQLIPPPPKPANDRRMPPPNRPWEVRQNGVVLPSQLLGIQVPEGSPEFIQYIHGCDPAIAKTREALEKPFCLKTPPTTLFNYAPDDALCRLVAVMAIRGYALAKYENAPAEALPYLIDSIRLARFSGVSEDTLRRFWGPRYDVAYPLMCTLARNTLSPPDIETYQHALEALGLPASDRRAELNDSLHYVDDTLTEPVPEHFKNDFPRNLTMRYRLWRIGRGARQIIANKDRYYALTQECHAKVLQTLSKEHPEWEQGGPNGWFDPSLLLVEVTNILCTQQAEHLSTVLALALERFKKTTGAYPETLTELVPSYLHELPVDPIACQPFGYQRKDNAYVIYSYGNDAKDNGGKETELNRPPYSFGRVTDLARGLDRILVAPPPVQAPAPKPGEPVTLPATTSSTAPPAPR